MQEVRTKIGNALFVARVVYGEPNFVTISPSSRHCGLVMRLSRVRANDPLLGHEDMLIEASQRIGSASYPVLELDEDVHVDLPDYDAQKC